MIQLMRICQQLGWCAYYWITEQSIAILADLLLNPAVFLNC